MKAKILLMEDEALIRDVLVEYLKMADYDVVAVTNGKDAVDALKRTSFDLCILDIMVPQLSGLEVLAWIEREELRMGKIMLTALGDEMTQLTAFNHEADDYIVKPVSPILLLKRIDAILRRLSPMEFCPKLSEKRLCLEAEAYRAYYDGVPLPLTLSEFILLKKLMEEPKRVFNRVQLIDALYGDAYYGSDRVIDSHIKNLRKKLPCDYVKTVIGVGYQFDEGAES